MIVYQCQRGERERFNSSFHSPSSSLILPSSPFPFSYPFSYPFLPPLLLLPTSPNPSYLELNLPRSHQTRNRLNRHSRRHYRRHDSFGYRQSFRKSPSPPLPPFVFLSFFPSQMLYILSDIAFCLLRFPFFLSFFFSSFFSFRETNANIMIKSDDHHHQRC